MPMRIQKRDMMYKKAFIRPPFCVIYNSAYAGVSKGEMVGWGAMSAVS